MKGRHEVSAVAAGFVSLVVVASSMVIPIDCAAEEIAEEERPNSLRPGSWAVQFEITDELGLIPFDNMTVSLRRHITRATALRLGMNLAFSYEDESREGEQTDGTVKPLADANEQNMQSVTLEPAWIHYFNPGSTFNLFSGAGPFFSYRRDRSEYGDAYSETTYYNRVWGVGLMCLGGAEWFIIKSISLHGEYRVSGSFHRSYQERTRTYTGADYYDRNHQEIRGDEWRFDGVDVMLGLSFYF